MSDRSAVMNAAVRLLAGRDHARAELAAKLRQRGHEAEVVTEVIEHLSLTGVLDDERFAATQTEILVRQQWGPLMIRLKLRQRGVAADVIERALGSYDDAEQWQQRARDRLERKYGRPATELDERQRAQAFRHLRSRGFDPATARAVVLA